MANDVKIDRDWKITYGSVVIGGAASGTNYHLIGKHELDLSYPVAVVGFDVMVTGDSDAEFNTRCGVLTAGFRKPRQRLLIELGAVDPYDFNPATNSGFNARPLIRKPGSKWDTKRSAMFTCRVEVDLPENLSQSGRRDSSISLRTLDTGLREVTITGQYTAVTAGAAAARANYDSVADTYCAAVTSGIDSDAQWDLADETAETDETDKVLQFRRVYAELQLYESPGAYDSDLKNQRLTVTVREASDPAGASDTSAERPKEVSAQYSVSVDSSVTDLVTKWASVCLPQIKAQMSLSVAGGLTYTEISPTIKWATNQIGATVRALAFSGVSLVSQTTETVDRIEQGKVFVPRADGVEHSYRIYHGPKTHWRTITRSSVRNAESDGGANVSPILTLPGSSGGEQGERLVDMEVPKGFMEVREASTVSGPFYVGLSGAQEELEGLVEVMSLIRVAEVED